MRLWKLAAGALKDRNSIVKASFRRRTASQNPDVEAAVIKATSHDESSVDYRNARRVFDWLRLSPAYMKPFIWALCTRVERSRSWVVVLKGLILVHGVFCCQVPAVQMMGRLPFDLSGFVDRHLNPEESRGFNMFVRVYYTFLNQKSSYLFLDIHEKKMRGSGSSVAQDLLRLQRLQSILDLLMDIKPHLGGAIPPVILEVMDCALIEIYDTYSRICDGIAKVLMRIRLEDMAEASVALRILQKSATQGDDLVEYFNYCKSIGVLNAAECPKVQPVPKEEICELERIINSDFDEKELPVEDKTIIVINAEEENDMKMKLKTVITNKWEVFDEDMIKDNGDLSDHCGRMKNKINPFDEPLIPYLDPYGYHQELPDLISF